MQLVLTKVGSQSNISALNARTSGVSGWAGRHPAGLKAHLSYSSLRAASGTGTKVMHLRVAGQRPLGIEHQNTNADPQHLDEPVGDPISCGSADAIIRRSLCPKPFPAASSCRASKQKGLGTNPSAPQSTAVRVEGCKNQPAPPLTSAPGQDKGLTTGDRQAFHV